MRHYGHLGPAPPPAPPRSPIAPFWSQSPCFIADRCLPHLAAPIWQPGEAGQAHRVAWSLLATSDPSQASRPLDPPSPLPPAPPQSLQPRSGSSPAPGRGKALPGGALGRLAAGPAVPARPRRCSSVHGRRFPILQLAVGGASPGCGVVPVVGSGDALVPARAHAPGLRPVASAA